MLLYKCMGRLKTCLDRWRLCTNTHACYIGHGCPLHWRAEGNDLAVLDSLHRVTCIAGMNKLSVRVPFPVYQSNQAVSSSMGNRSEPTRRVDEAVAHVRMGRSSVRLVSREECSRRCAERQMVFSTRLAYTSIFCAACMQSKVSQSILKQRAQCVMLCWVI